MIKCSNYKNGSVKYHGFIQVYYDDSYNKNKIIEEDYMLLKLLNYVYTRQIYYKTNILKKNDKYYLYIIDNYLYIKLCMVCDCFLNDDTKSIIKNVCKKCEPIIKIKKEVVFAYLNTKKKHSLTM